jgi:phytoene synthase
MIGSQEMPRGLSVFTLNQPVPIRPSLGYSFARTEELILEHSKTFFLATSLLPAAERRAIRALYAFCRTTDDLVDLHNASEEDVRRWQTAVARPANRQANPVLAAWAHIRQAYGVDPRYQAELIEGVRQDIVDQRYATWEDLRHYCYLVASTVGLMAVPILGLGREVTFEQAAPYAIKLGIALQLTNILRDVGEDAGRGRVYLPLADLGRFGLTADDILAGVHDERFEALMLFEIGRAQALYDEAFPGIALLSPIARPAVGTAALLYRSILHEIRLIGFRVHTVRAHTPGWRKLWMMPAILAKLITLRPPLPGQMKQVSSMSDC